MAQFNTSTIRDKVYEMINANWPPPIEEGDPMYIFEPFQATNEIKEAIKIAYFEAHRSQWGIEDYDEGPPEVGVPPGEYDHANVDTASPGPPAGWEADAIANWCPEDGTHEGQMISMAVSNYSGFSYVTFTVRYKAPVSSGQPAQYGLHVGDSIAQEEEDAGFPSIEQTAMVLNEQVSQWTDEPPHYVPNYWSPFIMAKWFGNSDANSGYPNYIPNLALRAEQNAAAMSSFITRLSSGIANQMNHLVYGFDIQGQILPITKVQALKVGANDVMYDYTSPQPVMDNGEQVATSYPFQEEPLLDESGNHIQDLKGQNYQTMKLDDDEDSDTFGEMIPDPTYNPNYGTYLYTTKFNRVFLGESRVGQPFTAQEPFITRDPITLDNVNLPLNYGIDDNPSNSLFVFETIFGDGTALNPLTDAPHAFSLTQTADGIHETAYCKTNGIDNLNTTNAALWRDAIRDLYQFMVRDYLKGWNYGEFSIDNGEPSWTINFAEAASPVEDVETGLQMQGTPVLTQYTNNNAFISFKMADLENMLPTDPDYPVSIDDYKMDYYKEGEDGEPVLDETLGVFTVNEPNSTDTTGSPDSVLIENGAPNPDYNPNYGDVIPILITDYVTDPDIIVIKSLDGKMAQRLPVLDENEQPTGEYQEEWLGGLSELTYLQTYMTSKKGYEPVLNEDYLVNQYDDEGNVMLDENDEPILLNQLPEIEAFMAWQTRNVSNNLLVVDNADGKSYRSYNKYAHIGGLKAKILYVDLQAKTIKVENKWRAPANSEVNIELDGNNVISVGDWFITNPDDTKLYMTGILHDESDETVNLATGKFRGELEDVIEDDIVVEDNAIYNKYIEFQGSQLATIMDYNLFCRCLAVEQSFGTGEIKNYQFPSEGLLLADGTSSGEFMTEDLMIQFLHNFMQNMPDNKGEIEISLAEAVARGIWKLFDDWKNNTRLKQNENSPLPYMSSFPPNVDIWGQGYISIMDLKLE